MFLGMLPCLTKCSTGVECPGCGFQRAVKLLFEGEFIASFLMYPALLPLVSLAIFTVFHLKFKFDNGAKIIIWLFSICSLIIATNYATYIYQIFNA